MRKTLLYVLLLGVLIAGLYVVFNREEGFSTKEANFTVSDTADIGKIFLANMSGNSILLERAADGWTVNNKYRAMASPTNTLLATLKTQKGISPVPEKEHNAVITGMAGTSIKVQVYNRKGELIREFYVGGETKNFDGSYMLMAGAERPFVVQIPGFAGYLSTRYSTELLDWRDRSIFLIPKEHIRSVSVQYPAEPLNSFVIRQEDGGKITMEAEPSLSMGRELNEKRAALFLSFFDKVYSEGYVGEADISAVLDTIPKRAIIDVTDKSGKNHHLDIYWRPIYRRSKNLLRDAEGIPSQFDADRGYGVTNDNKDTVVVQYQAFDKIFRKAWEFYEQDK